MSHYELHVTVEDFPSMKQASEFSDLCHTLGFKTNLIELSSGKFPLQLMMATKFNREDDGKALSFAMDVTQDFIREGWKPVRVKVETPVEAGTAAYYEAHWKFLIKTEEDRQNWAEFLKARSWGLTHPEAFLVSKNIFKKGLHYLSSRIYNEPHWYANNMFTDTENAILRQSPLRRNLEGGHYERVVYDSNPGIDAGWMVS